MITDDTYYPKDTGSHHTDWERGYAKGYERALSQVVELMEFYAPVVAEAVHVVADKLRKEVLHDAKVTQDGGS